MLVDKGCHGPVHEIITDAHQHRPDQHTSGRFLYSKSRFAAVFSMSAMIPALRRRHPGGKTMLSAMYVLSAMYILWALLLALALVVVGTSHCWPCRAIG